MSEDDRWQTLDEIYGPSVIKYQTNTEKKPGNKHNK